MFKFLVIAAILGVTLALPPYGHHEEAHVTHQSSQVNKDGSYGHELQLSNGVAIKESGVGGHYAKGGFRFVSPEGEHVELTYTADEHGFHPQGSHLPTPPPIPDEILKSIQYNQAHPTVEEQKDRQIRLQYHQ